MRSWKSPRRDNTRSHKGIILESTLFQLQNLSVGFCQEYVIVIGTEKKLDFMEFLQGAVKKEGWTQEHVDDDQSRQMAEFSLLLTK